VDRVGGHGRARAREASDHDGSEQTAEHALIMTR
jgi:hypothetical protein